MAKVWAFEASPRPFSTKRPTQKYEADRKSWGEWKCCRHWYWIVLFCVLFVCFNTCFLFRRNWCMFSVSSCWMHILCYVFVKPGCWVKAVMLDVACSQFHASKSRLLRWSQQSRPSRPSSCQSVNSAELGDGRCPCLSSFRKLQFRPSWHNARRSRRLPSAHKETPPNG